MSETSPITEQANPETELARDRCSAEDLPHDALQTIPRTEPVVQVLEQINAELEKLSAGAGRTEEEEEERRRRAIEEKQLTIQAIRHHAQIIKAAAHFKEVNDGGNSTHNTMRQRKKTIEMAPLKSGFIGAVSASAREQNNVVMAQQREPLLTGESERANDLTGAGIERLPDTPDDQDELKKLKGSKPRDMVDDFKSGWTGAVSASALEQNNVDMAQQREHLFTGEFEQAIDLSGGGIEVPREKGSKYRDMVDYFKSGWTLLLINLILEIASAVFDQLGYALVGMVLAFVALLLSTAELIYMEIMARRESRSLLPWKPVGTIVEYFGWVGAVWQCFYSTVEYAYARQKKDNPIKMCILPFIFLSCVVISKLIKTEFIDESA